MKKWMYKVILFLYKYGWRGIYAKVFRVYWRQDIEFINNGYDIISIRDKTGSYFRGTEKEVLAWITGISKDVKQYKKLLKEEKSCWD